MPRKAPCLLIHGGAGSRAVHGEKYLAYRDSLERVLSIAYAVLRKHDALRAVIRAAELLEDDPLFNAGRGSKIQSDGKIRMSAALMDGSRLRFSGCINVEGVKNPIRLAELLQNKKDRVLAEKGAAQFARAHGLAFASPFTARARAEYKTRLEGKSGTIGAVALDHRGLLAAATSTGGRGFEFPHRVSDTPTVAGNYANSACAVSATGIGEDIVDFSAAASIAAMVDSGRPLSAAVESVLDRARAREAGFGVIALGKDGRFVAQTTTETLIWAAATPNGLQVFKEAAARKRAGARA